ncbi:hypothetical protein Tco_1322154 [Tanacetum coccineum]
MSSSITRFNIEKLDGNIVQNHKGSIQVGLKQLGSKQVGFKQLGHKQVWFKQLGLGVERGVHEVQDEKHVWFEVELHRAQGDRADIMVTKVPGQKSPEVNVAGRKKMRSNEAKLGNLLKYRAWLTRRSSVRGSSIE